MEDCTKCDYEYSCDWDESSCEFVVKECKRCGKPFTVSKYRLSTKYCSDECRKESVKEAKRRYTRKDQNYEPVKKTGVCPVCGKEFPRNRANHTYCSDECKRENERAREALKRSPERKPRGSSEIEKKAVVKKRQKPIINLAVEARKRGLSYGQYVAMLESGAKF